MDRPADRLRKIRIERGFKSARAAARRFGWPVSGYTHHENGTRDLTRAFAKYAKGYRISEAWLRGLTDDPNSGVSGATVMGEAAIGVWRETSTPDMRKGKKDQRNSVPLPDTDEDIDNVRYAIRVADSSVNKRLAEGSFAICKPFPAKPLLREIKVGSMLHIERMRLGLREESLRRVVAVSGEKLKLSTHSTDASLKQEITYPVNGEGETVRLLGRVVGSYVDYKSD